MARLPQTNIPYSRVKLSIAQKILDLGYLGKITVAGEGIEKHIAIDLKYRGKVSFITAIERVSKPGRRMYIGAGKLKPVLSGYGSSILSTSQGIMSDQEARKAKVGGEIICRIW